MNKNPDYYTNLISRKLTGNIDSYQEAELKNWIEQSAENKKIYGEYKELWEIDPAIAEDQEEILINENTAWDRITERIDETEQNTKTVSFMQSSRAVLYTLTGIAAMFLLFWGLYYLLPGGSSVKMVTHEIKPGEIKELTLPDGSKVSFNGESTITFAESFQEKQRRVIFSGQAFFEVAENPGKPFIIELEKIPHSSIEVLGTSFYVNETVPVNNHVEVDVLTGRVKFGHKNESLLLGKDEKGILDLTTLKLNKDSLSHYNFLAWKTGVLQFSEAPLSEVFQSLEETYKIHIAAAGPVNEKKLTARFENEKPEDIFKTLSLLFGLEIEKTDQDQYLVFDARDQDFMNN
ncbi:MAG: FecR family protein [Bacteroidales bacterium]